MDCDGQLLCHGGRRLGGACRFDIRRDVDQSGSHHPKLDAQKPRHQYAVGLQRDFMACGLALIGNQSLGALGLEWLFLWLIATFIFVRGYVVAIRAGMSSIGLNAPRLGGGTVCYLAEVVGALLLVLGYGAGLYIAAVATIVLFAFLISGAWLLIVGIYEDQTKP